jgi:hypothetical protein
MSFVVLKERLGFLEGDSRGRIDDPDMRTHIAAHKAVHLTFSTDTAKSRTCGVIAPQALP